MITTQTSRGEIELRARLPRDLRRLAYVATWGVAAQVVLRLERLLRADPTIGVDSRAYWLAWRRPMYTTGPGTSDAYLYSPAFAQAMWLPSRLPYPVFAAVICLANLALLAWLLRPVGWKWALPLFLIMLPDPLAGNILVLIGAAAVIGLERPAAWAVPALTKITPTLGPIWWLSRREWRPLILSAGATAAIVALSAAISPHLWVDWLRFLISNKGGAESSHVGQLPMFPLVYRLPVGIALVAVGARRDWRWTIPVGMFVCAPVFWFGSYALLAAIPRMSRRRGGGPDAARDPRGQTAT